MKDSKIRYHIAVDIGASGGRLILGYISGEGDEKRIISEEIHRFPNGAVMKDGHLQWEYDRMLDEIVAGLVKCKQSGRVPSTLAIDTWGVDFVLLDENGELIGDMIAYRDTRTDGIDEQMAQIMPEEEFYARAGIQPHSFNTINQLLALKGNPEGAAQLEHADKLVFTPEYFNYMLTGKTKTEYTIASTSQLLNVRTKTWDAEVLGCFGINPRIFGEICQPGCHVGYFCDEIKSRVGFDCEVLLGPLHDTAAAVLAVPSAGDDSIYLSSGTWSLIGVTLDTPITTPEALHLGFTNEGGMSGYRFLKNISGMWFMQSLRGQAETPLNYAEAIELAKSADGFETRIDVSDQRFMAPKSMFEEICGYCGDHGLKAPENIAQALACVYGSIAECYAASVKEIERLTGRKYSKLHVMGGGSQDSYLNALTRKLIDIDIYAGPKEATAIGNLMSQMIAGGEFSGIDEARETVYKSFDIIKL